MRINHNQWWSFTSPPEVGPHRLDRIEGESSESPSAPGNDTSTRSGKFLLSFNSCPGHQFLPRTFMVSWNTSARVRESTGALGMNLPADSGMAKPQGFKPGDRWLADNLADQPLNGSSA